MPFVNAIFFLGEQFQSIMRSLENLKQSMIKQFDELEKSIKENIANLIQKTTFTQSLSYLIDTKIEFQKIVQFISSHPLQWKEIVNHQVDKKQHTYNENHPYIKCRLDEIKEEVDFLKYSIKQQFSYILKKYLKKTSFIVTKAQIIQVKDLNIIKMGSKKDSSYIDLCAIMQEKAGNLQDVNKITIQIIRGTTTLLGVAPPARLQDIRHRWKGQKQFGLYSINQQGVVSSPYQEEHYKQTNFKMNEQDIITLTYDQYNSKLEYYNYNTKEKAALKIDKNEIQQLEFVVGLEIINDQVNIISY